MGGNGMDFTGKMVVMLIIEAWGDDHGRKDWN